MRYEKINDKNQIILEDGESVYINNSDYLNTDCVEVSLLNGKLVSTPINKAREKFDLEFAKAELKAEKNNDCERWISEYLESHNTLKEIAKSPNGIFDKAQVILKLNTLYELGKPVTNGKSHISQLNISLYKNSTPCIVGSILNLDNFNEEEFKYIFAWVFDYFVTDIYGADKINEIDFYSTWILYSNEPRTTIFGDRIVPSAVADLRAIQGFGDDYKEIVSQIIRNHNNFISSKLLLNELRNNITGDKNIVHDSLKSSIERSKENNKRIEEEFRHEYHGEGKYK